MIVLFTDKNPASANIAKSLIARHGFARRDAGCPLPGAACWERGGVRLIGTGAPSVLEVPTDFETDCIIVLSTHRSKTPGKMLTAHVPGNWGDAGMGGEPRTLNIAHAPMLRRILLALRQGGDRIGWPVSLEADHHGPTCGTPILFVEIGNGEEQWADAGAADAVADAVAGALFGPPLPEPETAISFGGGHYQREITKLSLGRNIAVGHMAPKYAIDGMDEGMFRQAIEKNVGKVVKVLILKDETNAAQKERILAFAKKAGLGAELV